MSAQQLQHSKYGFSKTVDLSYEDTVEKARAALKAEGFGVLCEIDIKEKLKEKLGVRYKAPLRPWRTRLPFSLVTTHPTILALKEKDPLTKKEVPDVSTASPLCR